MKEVQVTYSKWLKDRKYKNKTIKVLETHAYSGKKLYVQAFVDEKIVSDREWYVADVVNSAKSVIDSTARYR